MAPTTSITRFFIATSIAVLSVYAQAGSSAPQQTVGSGVHAWNGTLIDATRTDCGPEVGRSVPAGTCPVSMQTKEFGLRLADGKFVKFDEGGNAKALYALRRSRRGAVTVFEYWKTGTTSRPVRAHVTGTLTSDTLNLDSIKIE